MSDGVGNAALLALVALVPLLVLMLTSFVKLSVVLALLRNAIGAPDAPSGLVVIGLSLVLTFFVMAPVGIDMIRAAGTPGGASSPTQPSTPAPSPGTTGATPAGTSAPATGTPGASGNVSAGTPGASGNVSAGTPGASGNVSAGTPGASGNASAGTPGAADGGSDRPLVALELEEAVRALVPAKYHGQVDAAERALGPLQAFLARHADVRDRETFIGLAGRMGRATDGDEVWVLAPAFLTTELREAFAIAVLIFLPFLVIDLVVGLGLAALGLATTQPQTIALPLKLLLFVAVDGWRLLVDALLRGYV